MSIEPGVLYVVATPIGNLNDISHRAISTLREVDLIAAEDTRRTGRLLQHLAIEAKLISFHDHNESDRIPGILNALRAGSAIALVSDAGTPLVSDPGFHLLEALQQAGLRAVPVPGPSSLMAALSVAGLPTDRFVFEGFLPARSAARRSRLAALSQERRTIVFFEASHRIRASLEDMEVVFGQDRRAVVARELTKLNEEVRGGSLAELGQWLRERHSRSKGEFVVLLRGVPKQSESQTCVMDISRLLQGLLEELPTSRAVAVAAKLTGRRKNVLYELALSLEADSGCYTNRGHAE